jgi:hypothetical protein
MAEPGGGLQLLPETRRRVEIKGKKKRGSIFLGVFLIILVVAGYVAADFYLTSLNDELGVLDEQVSGIEQRRDKDAESDVKTLNSQLALIGNLLDGHVFWTEGFDRMEDLTVPQLRFVSMNADAAKGEIAARVQATSYSELAKQISSYFADDAIESVDVSGITLLGTGQVEASLLIKFNKSKFLHNI